METVEIKIGQIWVYHAPEMTGASRWKKSDGAHMRVTKKGSHSCGVAFLRDDETKSPFKAEKSLIGTKLNFDNAKFGTRFELVANSMEEYLKKEAAVEEYLKVEEIYKEIANPKAGQIWEWGIDYGEHVIDDSPWVDSVGAYFEVMSTGDLDASVRFLKKDESPIEKVATDSLLGLGTTVPIGLIFFNPTNPGGHCRFVANSLKELKGAKVETEPTRKKSLSKWSLAEKVIPESRLVLLYGPPGTGKTTAGNRIGLRGGVVLQEEARNDGLLSEGSLVPVYNIYNITLTEETPAVELRGHYHMRGGDFVWQDGVGMMPFRNGGRLVLNEIDKASGDCLQFCHALLDDPDIAAITLPTGETVRPNADFSVLATMNGEPEDLPEALRDRFTIRIEIPMPHPKAIKSLPEDLREPCKKSYNAGETGLRGITFRTWKQFGKLREVVGEDIAAQAVFGDRAQNILNTLRIGRG